MKTILFLNGMLIKNNCKPILFSTPMVQAILRGEKTQTRRIVKHKYLIEDIRPVVRCVENENDWGKYIITDGKRRWESNGRTVETIYFHAQRCVPYFSENN